MSCIENPFGRRNRLSFSSSASTVRLSHTDEKLRPEHDGFYVLLNNHYEILDLWSITFMVQDISN